MSWYSPEPVLFGLGRRPFEVLPSRVDPELIDSPALGHALIKYRYDSTDSAKQPHKIESWLALTFALEGGKGRLVFDQNTPLTAGAKR